MTIDKQVREVLKKLQEQTSIHLVNQGCIGCNVCENNIDQALTQIKEELLERLPKEKDEKDYNGSCSPCNPHPKNYRNVAFNDCLSQVKEVISKVCGGENDR